MTIRVPLVIVSGQIQQLQAGDTIASGGATTPTIMQSNLSIADYTQMLFRQHIVIGSRSIIMGTGSSLIGV